MTPVTSVTDQSATVAHHWSSRTASSPNWWTKKAVIKWLNWRICGESSTQVGHGVVTLAKRAAAGRALERGVSVGCGLGIKELALVEAGLVQRLTGYDLAEDRIAKARANAAAKGLSDRVEFIVGDAFAMEQNATFDLVYWDNSLHHMFDVRAAVAWSHRVLRPGGVFAMDDYVGPNRLGVSDVHLRFVNRVREPLPDRLFESTRGPLPKRLKREWLQRGIQRDPSETVDAEATLPAIREFFPQALIVPTGGLVYFIAMNGLFAHLQLDVAEDSAILSQLLLLDETYTESHPDSTIYAVAVGLKED